MPIKFIYNTSKPTMKNQSDIIGDSLTATSVIGTIVHYATELQPLVSFTAGLIAIVSGIMAIRYYYIKTKHYGKGKS